MATRFLRQWWTQTSDVSLLKSQNALLARLVRAPMAQSGRSSAGLNSVEFISSSAAATALPTVVLAHGFGSGLGFFFRNIDPLLQSGQVGRVLLADWLGMGGSERPPCRRPIRSALLGDNGSSWCQSRFSPSQAVDFFLDPFHVWMKEHVLSRNEPYWLVGHSLGGYLAARYALQYAWQAPGETQLEQSMQKLVLASPVGFPSKPKDALSSSQLPTSLRLVDALWSANVTPQQLVRAMGATRGRRNVARALQGRIPHLQNDPVAVQLLSDYLYHITVAHPSGEFAMNSLLEPGVSPDVMGVFSREPLEDLFVQERGRCSPNMDVHVLFGDHDWMRPNEPTARRVMSHLTAKHPAVRANVTIIPDAGHHLYLDNPDAVCSAILAQT